MYYNLSMIEILDNNGLLLIYDRNNFDTETAISEIPQNHIPEILIYEK